MLLTTSRRGQSTFYVEMSELAYILSSAAARSLIILDEIGRGTSTYDGLSIAWAVVEHLAGSNTHIRTLFATHYHELTVLEGQVAGVRNLNVDVSEAGGEYRLSAQESSPAPPAGATGIHVAKLAGIPSAVLARAREKLAEL